MRFSQTEIKDLLRAWLLISLAFAIAFHGFSLSVKFLLPFAISAFTAGVGFLLHELAHKAVAQKYGCWAEFRAFDQMLWLSVALSFLGVIFAAPGAVMIRGLISARKHGIIALAGPATNMVLGFGFLVVALLFPTQLAAQVGVLGARINFWLGLFNMLPFMGLDGTKVLLWNKTVYASALILSIILVFGSSWVV